MTELETTLGQVLQLTGRLVLVNMCKIWLAKLISKAATHIINTYYHPLPQALGNCYTNYIQITAIAIKFGFV